MSNDLEKQNPLLEKRKSPIELSQTSNSNTNPNNGGFAAAKKAKISLDETLKELKKKAANFNVERAVFWEKGERVPFMFVAMALDAISNESDQIVITEILCNMLRTVIKTTPDDLVAVVYLFSERIVSPYESADFFLGANQYHIAIAEACRAKVEDIEKHLKELGDVSLVAQARLPVSKPEYPLTVVKVYETFTKFAKSYAIRGIKTKFIKALLVAATGCEPLYLIRLILRMHHQRVQLRLEEQTLLTALGHAALYSMNAPLNPLELEEAARVVKEVYSAVPIYDKLVPDLLLGGVWKLRETCTIAPGIPFKVMRPKQIIGSVSEIFDKFQDREFICEYKYPGERALIHYMENGQVEVYCTDGRRITEKYLGAGFDVVRLKQPSVRSFIIECQLVVHDRKKEKIQPSKISEMCWVETFAHVKVQACVFASDILYLNGELLLQEQLKVRREHLHQSFQEQPGLLQFATASTSTDLEAINKFVDESVKSGCPQLIIKTLTKDATYEPGKRSENWLELEKGYVEYIHPCLDLVPIAALCHCDLPDDVYFFLLACYDSGKDEYQSICTMRHDGAILDERLDSLWFQTIPKAKPNYNCKFPKSMGPATWFEPTQVWEVKGASLLVSLAQPAAVGTVDPEKGIMLQSPHLVRVLADKDPKQASSPAKVGEMYESWRESYEFYTRDLYCKY